MKQFWLHLRGLRSAIFLVVAAGAPLGAQSQAPAAAHPNAQAAAAQQYSALTAMQDSLAKQRASVLKQMGATPSGGFFIQPPPASLGAVTFAPAITPAVADCDPLPASEIDALVGRAAKREGLEEDLLRNVMKQESGFRPCAVSPKGALGLMQLMPSTAQEFGVKDPFDAASNVDTGAKFLKQLLTKYDGDLSKALGAYNAGPAKVDAAGRVPDIPETLDYVRQILSGLTFRLP